MSNPQTISFLDLPIEIRLQIYSEILCSHPAKHALLAREPLQHHSTTYKHDPTTHRSRLPQRPVCKLPTSLLRSCRTIYLESRKLPFTKSLFTFISQYNSALYNAIEFLSARTAWERESIHSFELEALSEDLFPPYDHRFPADSWDRNMPQYARWFVHIESMRVLVRGRLSQRASYMERLGDGMDWPATMFVHLKELKTIELAFEDYYDCEWIRTRYTFPQPWRTNFGTAMIYHACNHDHKIKEGDLKQELHMEEQISGK